MLIIEFGNRAPAADILRRNVYGHAWARHAPEKVYYKAYLRLVPNWVTTSNITGHGSSFFESQTKRSSEPVPASPCRPLGYKLSKAVSEEFRALSFDLIG